MDDSSSFTGFTGIDFHFGLFAGDIDDGIGTADVPIIIGTITVPLFGSIESDDKVVRISAIVSDDQFAVDIILLLGSGIAVELGGGLSIDLTGFADNTIVTAESSGGDGTVDSQDLLAAFGEVQGLEFSTFGDGEFAVVLPVNAACIDGAGDGGFRISDFAPFAIDHAITGIHGSAGVSTAIEIGINGVGCLTADVDIVESSVFSPDVGITATGDAHVFKRTVENVDHAAVGDSTGGEAGVIDCEPFGDGDLGSIFNGEAGTVFHRNINDGDIGGGRAGLFVIDDDVRVGHGQFIEGVIGKVVT